MATGKNFLKWLNIKLRELKTDENVYGSYIIGILDGDESIEEKKEALEEILSQIIVSECPNVTLTLRLVVFVCVIYGVINVDSYEFYILNRKITLTAFFRRLLRNGNSVMLKSKKSRKWLMMWIQN